MTQNPKRKYTLQARVKQLSNSSINYFLLRSNFDEMVIIDKRTFINMINSGEFPLLRVKTTKLEPQIYGTAGFEMKKIPILMLYKAQEIVKKHAGTEGKWISYPELKTGQHSGELE